MNVKFEFIAHRINRTQELLALPPGLGVEIDIRDDREELILRHDPFSCGDEERLNDFLINYRNRGTLILNIKSERIEYKVQELLKKYRITNYFFLDSSFPMIHLLATHGEKNIALRFSEWEGMDTLEKMKGRVKWIWVDCFTRFPLTKVQEELFHSWGYKICIVSPELQGRDSDIEEYRRLIEGEGIVIDAVCSKIRNYERWMGV